MSNIYTPTRRHTPDDDAIIYIDDVVGPVLLQALIGELTRLEGAATPEWIEYLTSYAYYLRSHLPEHSQLDIPHVRSRPATNRAM